MVRHAHSHSVLPTIIVCSPPRRVKRQVANSGIVQGSVIADYSVTRLAQLTANRLENLNSRMIVLNEPMELFVCIFSNGKV